MQYVQKIINPVPVAKVSHHTQQAVLDAPAFQFKDNRSASIAQQHLQSLADRSHVNNRRMQLQAKADTFSLSKTTIQRKDLELKNQTGTEHVQLKPVELTTESIENPVQKKANTTGMPDKLKSGVENLSGIDMSDVKVQYNSSQPAQLNAHAYAQGTNIHIAPGQEKHLPHEAWHVVQQKQGRVKPTLQMKQGVAVNDDKGLEKEADVMGEKASGNKGATVQREVNHTGLNNLSSALVVQGNFKDRAIGKLNQEAEQDPEEGLLGESTCGPAARIIYKVLQTGGDSAGTGVGIASLVSAMSDADTRRGQVFIYYVDADIVGHFFTILQNATEAVIIQGYLDKITIAQNIKDEGGAHHIWKSSDLRNDLQSLVRLRNQIKDNFDNDPDEEGLAALGVVHTRLFGPGTDREERAWIKRNILRKRTDDLTWKASFAEGNGPKLNTAPASGGWCFLTTACVQYLGLPDDCEELTVLRKFRDGYMSDLEGGRQMIHKYYEIAPGIVEAIYSLPNEDTGLIWKSIYLIIRACVDSIKKGDHDFALRTYKSCVLELEEQYVH